MKLHELKLVYFSPTGTTRRLIMETARNIDGKSISYDFSVHKEKKPVLRFSETDFALFAIPVYYGRVPALFMEYLQNISGSKTPAALIAAYGCREYEDALLELKTEVEQRGFKVIGAAAFPTEHSIVPEIGSRRPNKSDLKTAAEYGTELNRRLKKMIVFVILIRIFRGTFLTENMEKMHSSPKQTSAFVQNAGSAPKSVPQEPFLLMTRKRQTIRNVSAA